ncbi:hypothetical protein PMZ80_008153 [Knufia obscura]|uniref:Uncharacterized protein n=2 Tax=Knufia TaxID=430999 RepID=A0AAN8I6Q8_9EURO|nr:hypothetical protein PMZ80_008153 [Knufia obscura]KAK5957122.1 hypothetical protein OHC33_001491 [Knufia fluminis]
MASSEQGYAGTPTQRVGFKHTYRKSDDLKGPFVHPTTTRDNRSLSGGSTNGPNQGLQPGSFGLPMPGSFNPEMRSIAPSRSHTPQNELSSSAPHRAVRISTDEERPGTTEERQAAVRDKIAKEMKIKMGTENMLEALMAKNAKQTRDQRIKVEQELGTSNFKLAKLQQELDDEIKRALTPLTPPTKRMSSYFKTSPRRAPDVAEDGLPEEEEDDGVEDTSPTVIFTDVLQQLEVEGMQPDYYIERANRLVDLFKKNTALKYDIAWSVFSGRVQLMLLSESTDVVAAGYRLTRHAIADRSSLKTIRALHTDELVTLSLVKKGKALLEREQAVKFVRAFLDVKDGVHEISLAVVRSLVAIAEHQEDRLRNMSLLTLAELLAKIPGLLIAANGMTTLSDALAEGAFPAPEGLVASFLYLLDHPRQRKYLGSGREFEAMFAPFTDPLILAGDEEKLKTCAKGISAMMKTWPGYLTLAQNGAAPLKSLIDSLVYPNIVTRDLILELIFDILRIKPPSWSSSFLAGRRLTTYGRVNNMVDPNMKRSVTAEVTDGRFDLTTHFTAVILATLLRAGLVPALMDLIKFEEASAMKRKSTLLVTEVLKLAHHSLPRSMSARIQVLGDLLSPIDATGMNYVASNTSMVYQIESINRTANRTGTTSPHGAIDGEEMPVGQQAIERAKFTATMDAKLFAQAVLDTGVPNHTNYTKWNWNLINNLIDGPLTNQKLLEETIRTSKFVKRLVGFYRPFKWRFSVIRNTRPNQRYVRTGCALMRALCQTQLGVQYLSENKLMRQIGECLAQLDQHSGLTSTSPLFDKHNMIDYLTGGYFTMLGALSESPEGIQIMERWHMMNMFYHIMQLPKRDDLLKAFLGSMDYSLDTHLRVMLSQALTASQKVIRLFATKLLRKYAVGRMRYSAGMQDVDSSQWAIKLVLTQLYDPDVEVCEVAVRILEEACDQPSHLEFVVKCRPALDHLGEIGAPLLLRFLSISTGYRYLSGLDYIHQEMDDWFLGRNDSYVAQVEASLTRAYLDPSTTHRHAYNEDPDEYNDSGLLPPHFYRELARTEEGCKLLLQSGHFYEFASTIREFRLDDEEPESLTKLKGCMWAVGNIGSMEMGAPFLEESDIVRSIVRIAEGAEVMSVRGTAVFALGLISRTTHGYAMLTECNWAITTDSGGRSLGLCIPLDPSRLCLKPKPPERICGERQQHPQHMQKYRAATTDADPLHARILKLIVDMGNSVMYKKVAADLQVLKAKHAGAFTSVKLFQKSLFILESHHYRLQARQFILDLFDKRVMRMIVLEEETEESTSESDTG